MKQFSNKAIVAFIIVLSTISVYSQTAGNSGLSFLKFGFGARNISMGDAGTALSNDLTSLFYNPAKLVFTDESEVMFMHNEWIQAVSYTHLRAHETVLDLVCRLLLEKKQKTNTPELFRINSHLHHLNYTTLLTQYTYNYLSY